MALKWTEVRELGLRGQGWDASALAHPYDRLPAHAEAVATANVWNLSRHSAGLYVDFRTDATELHARIVLRQPGDPQHHYRKYLDLYARDPGGRWRWAGVSANGYVPSGQTSLRHNLSAEFREYRLYLPMFFVVERLELGLPTEATLAPCPAPETTPRVAWYGTSIVHATPAVRPGVAFTSILARRLGLELWNLGFDGSAQMEPPLAEVFCDLAPDLFVIDPVANMGLELIRQNALPFLRKLLGERPKLPLLLVEDRTHTQEWLWPHMADERARKRAAFQQIAEQLQDEGYTVHYHPGAGLLGDDSEGTIDGSHPTELGYFRMADDLEPTLARILGRH